MDDGFDNQDFGTAAGEGIPQNAASISVIGINARKFVSGLFWQPLTKPRAYMNEAREIGKREGMDVVTIRRRKIMQAGFAPKGKGAIKGMFSLAAALAMKLGTNWIGVFSVGGDQYAFVAVNDDAIIPSCDMIASRDEVESRLRYFYGMFSWEKVYAPQDFDFGGEELELQTLLTGDSFSKRQWNTLRLQPLTFGLTGREIALYVLAAILLGGGALGFLQYTKEMERKEREARILAEQARLAEMERVKANSRNEQAIHALEHPWIKMPAVEDTLRGCGGAINNLPLALAGWGFESAKCDAGGVVARYRRVGTATANGFAAEIQEAFGVAPTFIDDFETATVTVPVKMMFGGDDSLQPSAEVMPNMASFFQAMGIKVGFVEKSVEAPKPAPTLPGQAPTAVPETPPVPDWKTYTFRFDTGVAPEIVFSGRAWSGTRITHYEVQLTPDTAKLLWLISGEMYAK